MNETDIRIAASIQHATGRDVNDWIKKLRDQSDNLNTPQDFPLHSIIECSGMEARLQSQGSVEWDVLKLYQRLARGCLTTAFIMSQRDAARRRIVSSPNVALSERIRCAMDDRQAFVTVGISHLTTSRRYLQRPVLGAKRCPGGWSLNGYAPWVTGAKYAEWIVVGAMEESESLEAPGVAKPENANELLFLVPTNSTGITIEPGEDLVALSASSTGSVRFDAVDLDESWVLHGPISNVMHVSGSSSGAGGLHTSALALGHGEQSIDYLKQEANRRPDLNPIVDRFEKQISQLNEALENAAKVPSKVDAGGLRKEANDFVLNATHAALVAAKGAGFVAKHPAGRWCREALFFLVWSCPPHVAHSHLCSWAC